MTNTKFNTIPTLNSEHLSKKLPEQPAIKIEVTDDWQSTIYAKRAPSLKTNKSQVDYKDQNKSPATKITWQRNRKVPSKEKRRNQSQSPLTKKRRIVKDENIRDSGTNEWSPAQRRPSREWSPDDRRKYNGIKEKTTYNPDKAQMNKLNCRKSSEYTSRQAYEKQEGQTKIHVKNNHKDRMVKETAKNNLETENAKVVRKSRLSKNSDSSSDSDAEDDDGDDEDGDDKSKIEKIAEAEMKRRSNVERAKREAEKETEMRKTLMKRIKKNSEDANKAVLPEGLCHGRPTGKDQKTLLDKVNEIIISCVKLKEDKNISEEKLIKANSIIEKAEEKRKKLTEQAEAGKKSLNESTDDGRRTPLAYRKSKNENNEAKEDVDELDDGRLTPLAYRKNEHEKKYAEENNACKQKATEKEGLNENKDDKDDGRRTPHAYRRDGANSESVSEFELEMSLDSKIKEHLEDDNEHEPETFLEDGELKESSEADDTWKELDDNLEADCKPTKNALNEEPKYTNKEAKSKEDTSSRKQNHSRSISAYSSESKSRSNSRTQSKSRSRSRSFTRSRSRSRYHSTSRSRSRSKERYYSRACDRRGGGRVSGHRGGHHDDWRRDDRYRERSPGSRQGHHWIPATPCAMEEDMHLAPGETRTVYIRAKGEFSFKDNAGCMVRITKWTGKDSVNHAQIRSQIIELERCSTVKIEVTNPDKDHGLELMKQDKIGCLSVLSAPTYPGLFTNLDCSPHRYQTDSRRWFKFTTVVLHKKGIVSSTKLTNPDLMLTILFYVEFSIS